VPYGARERENVYFPLIFYWASKVLMFFKVPKPLEFSFLSGMLMKAALVYVAEV
jgi:hypothetical protein